MDTIANFEREVHGWEQPSGTMLRTITDEGVVSAESGAEAVAWLLAHGPIWDNLSTDRQFTITIRPAAPEVS